MGCKQSQHSVLCKPLYAQASQICSGSNGEYRVHLFVGVVSIISCLNLMKVESENVQAMFLVNYLIFVEYVLFPTICTAELP